MAQKLFETLGLLRQHLLAHEAYLKRCVYATTIEVTPLTEDGFEVAFAWRDGSRYAKKVSLEIGSVEYFRREPCRFRRELVGEVLRFKGV